MARVVSAPKLTRLNALGLNYYVWLEVEDGAGVMQDLTTFLGADWLDAGTWTENQDQPVASGTITLRREAKVAGTSISLSPSMQASPANRLGDGSYSPLLAAGRRIRIYFGWTDPDVAPVGADKMWMFDGKIDVVNWKGLDSQVTLDVRDLAGWLQDTIIEEVRNYSDDTGTPVESVMQQILDDNPQSKIGHVTLYTPVSPGWNIRAFAQDKKSVLDALLDLARQIGWDVRWVWREATSRFELTFYEPDRAKVASDWTLGPDQYLDVTDLKQSDANVRNRIEVLATAVDGTPITSLFTDGASIAKFGERYMEVIEEATSNIDTQAEADAMTAAMGSDLKDPIADQEIENYLYPIAQLGDMGTWLANGKQYDHDQQFAVVQLKHEFSREKRRTFIQCRGRVAGAYNAWLLLAAQNQTSSTSDPTKIVLKDWKEKRRDPNSITFGFTASAAVTKIALYQWTQPASQDVAWPDGTQPPTKWLTPDTTEITVDLPPADKITYLSVEPYNDSDGALTRGEVIHQRVFAVDSPPVINNFAQQTAISGLFSAVSFDVLDAKLLGGTVRAWTNAGSEDSANSALAPDGTVTIANTPAHLDATTVFTKGDGTTATLLSNVPVHPGRGKRTFFEFVDAQGVTSGIVSVVLISQGGIIDANGDLIDGVIKAASQFAAAIAPVQVLGALPAGAPDNTLVFLTTDGQLYRRIGGAWTLEVKAVNLSGQVVATQIADAAINTAKFAAGIKPVELLATTTGSPGVNRVALNTIDGKLYRSSPDGTSWVAAVAAVDISGQINSAQIADAAITAAKIGAAAVQTANIAAAAITTTLMANSAVTNAIIAAGAVTSTSITDGSISTPKLAAGAVTAAKITAGTITSNEIAATTITAANMVAGTITTAQIAAGTITASNIAAATITGGKIAAGTIVASNLVAGTITSNELAANSVTATQITAAAVTAGKVAAGAISTTELAANAVTAAKIAAGTITTNEIAALTITGVNIAASAITAAKIFAGTITSNELAANSIVAGKIAAGAINSSSLFVSGVVTATIISVSNLAAISSDLGIIVSGKLTSANGHSFIDLNATGASPFIRHADSSGNVTIDMLANGSATFYGTVASTLFTALGATFQNSINLIGGAVIGDGTATMAELIFPGTHSAPGRAYIGSDGTDIYFSPYNSGGTRGVVRKASRLSSMAVPGVIVLPAAPSNPGNYSQGDFWIDDTGPAYHLYFNDGANWLQIV